MAMFSYRNASTILKEQSLARLSDEIKRESNLLQRSFSTMSEDVLFLSNVHAVTRLIKFSNQARGENPSATSNPYWRQQVQGLFATILRQRRNYVQIRVIGLKDGGREIVRVERNKDDIIKLVKQINLQLKGARDYYKNTIGLKRGQVYFSQINLNREQGQIESSLKPMLRFATPVFTPAGEMGGIVIINVDFRQLTASLTKSPENIRYFLTNDSGHYLVHSNVEKTFSFEFGKKNRVQDDYPGVDFLTCNNCQDYRAYDVAEKNVGIVFHTMHFDPLQKDRFLILGATASHTILNKKSSELAQTLTLPFLVIIFLLIFLKGLNTYLLSHSRKHLQEQNAILEKLVAKRTRELQSKQKQVLTIIENEQRRIGHDLHDNLGQNLTGISFMVKTLEEKLAKNKDIKKEDVMNIGHHIKESIAQTRKLASGLYPVKLEQDDFILALRELAYNVETMFDVRCHIVRDKSVIIRDKSVATHIYRIIQEAMSNAIRHGAAKNVEISVINKDEDIIFIVSDDGSGMRELTMNPDGMGITIMKYRANAINGVIEFSNNPENGATIKLTVSSKTLLQTPIPQNTKGHIDDKSAA